MRYTHFVFDIDNTLINTTGAVLHGLQRALRDITCLLYTSPSPRDTR